MSRGQALTDDTSQLDNLGTRSGQFSSSRDEMNLAEFPLTVLSTRVNTEVKTLEFVDTHRAKNGELVERTWIITGADKFGLPTATDDDVVLGLICLTMDNGFRDRKVYFTRYELLKILRWTSEGRSYQRLTKSLDRLSGVRVRASNAFYDNTAKAYQTINFGIIDAYEINDERNAKAKVNGEVPKSYFIWSEAMFESFKAGFIKKLDLDVYFSLRSAVSRRLYRYLDKHFYYRSVIEKPLMTFAFEKIGLSRSYKYVSSVKQQIEPAADELVKIGFLAGYDFTGRGEGTMVRFTSGSQPQPAARIPAPLANREGPSREGVVAQVAVRESAAVAPQTPPQPELRLDSSSELVNELSRRGISQTQSVKLVRALPFEQYKRVGEILRYYDFLIETNDRRISRNPVGFLYRAVEQPAKFVVPASFRDASPQSVATSNRPELRVVRSDEPRSANGTSKNVEAERYKRYADREVARFREKLDPKELDALYQRVLDKLSCLRPVLDPTKFEEAVEGCVFRELKRDAGVLDLQAWKARGEF